jgi:hypothetical protein
MLSEWKEVSYPAAQYGEYHREDGVVGVPRIFIDIRHNDLEDEAGE